MDFPTLEYEKKLWKKGFKTVAGFGTRFLPQTKAMPKEMLPQVSYLLHLSGGFWDFGR